MWQLVILCSHLQNLLPEFSTLNMEEDVRPKPWRLHTKLHGVIFPDNHLHIHSWETQIANVSAAFISISNSCMMQFFIQLSLLSSLLYHVLRRQISLKKHYVKSESNVEKWIQISTPLSLPYWFLKVNTPQSRHFKWERLFSLKYWPSYRIVTSITNFMKWYKEGERLKTTSLRALRGKMFSNQSYGRMKVRNW